MNFVLFFSQATIDFYNAGVSTVATLGKSVIDRIRKMTYTCVCLNRCVPGFEAYFDGLLSGVLGRKS